METKVNIAPDLIAMLIQEVRDTRAEMELLREAVGCSTITRGQACRMLHKDPKTLRRYEIDGKLQRLDLGVPGIHYAFQAVLDLKRQQS